MSSARRQAPMMHIYEDPGASYIQSQPVHGQFYPVSRPILMPQAAYPGYFHGRRHVAPSTSLPRAAATAKTSYNPAPTGLITNNGIISSMMTRPFINNSVVGPTISRPSVKRNVVLNPHDATMSMSGRSRSPQKLSHFARFQPRVVFNDRSNVNLPAPEEPSFVTDNLQKRPTYTNFKPMGATKPVEVLFTSFPTAKPADKENTDPTIHNDNFAEFPQPSQKCVVPPPQSLIEAPAGRNRHQKAVSKDQPVNIQIPEPGDFPLVVDDGLKPAQSYSTLIGMAILRSPERRLTLRGIYKWITDNYSFYRGPDLGWQNSIRHNLSLQKTFVKHAREKEDPGKGSYWEIKPGMEGQFLKDKPARRPVSAHGPAVPNVATKMAVVHKSSIGYPVQKNTVPKIQTKSPEVIDLCSDGTISAHPTSPLDEAGCDVQARTELLGSSMTTPIDVIDSSPPVAQVPASQEKALPAAPIEGQNQDHRGGRKRKVIDMDDSGYFSSGNTVESKTRPLGQVAKPENDVNPPKIRSGRAEEEIARIRASCLNKSPSKGKGCIPPPAPASICSSPILDLNDYSVLSPWSPALKFKLTPKPAATLSPTTSLRNHRKQIRELVGSPVKSLDVLAEASPFSSALNPTETEDPGFPDITGETGQQGAYFNQLEKQAGREMSGEELLDAFNWYDYVETLPPGHHLRETCPERPPKRPRLERAVTTGNVLAEITGNVSSGNILHKIENCPDAVPEAPVTDLYDELMNPEFSLEDVAANVLMEVDILQGFQKIGEK